MTAKLLCFRPMCGIGGILRITPKGQPVQPIPESWLDAIDEKIAHRGPDGAGRFRDSVVREDGATVEVALVHRRLSIIDHAGGAQPMVSERGLRRADGTDEGLVAVVFNGCIYNHRDLRRELERKGRRFVTDHSDTEVLTHGWRQWGVGLWDRIDGMFACAVWDRSGVELLLARDRFGEKPHYWKREREGDGWIVGFASTATALNRWSAFRGGRGRIQSGWMREWMRFGFAAQPCMDVCAVRRSRCVLLGTRTVTRGHSSNRWPQESALRGADLTAVVDATLERAVQCRLEADVPLGCFLSGGIDSSLIAVYAARARPDLMTFTVRMPDARLDESAWANMVASRLGTRHRTLDVEAQPAHDLVHLIEQLGLPLGDSSILPTYWLCKAASAHVRVALSGDGGDELFAGYERHRVAAIGGWKALALLLLPRSLLPQRDTSSRFSRLARLINSVRWGGYPDLVALFQRQELSGLLGPQGFGRSPPTHGVTEALAWDRKRYLCDDILRKTDTASMAVGLEVRAPFLSRGVADLASLLAPAQLVPGGERKGLLKAVAALYLPPEIVKRPKQGFAIPISDWFRTDFGGMRSSLLDHLSGEKPFGVVHDALEINMGFVRQMIDEHWAAGGLTPLYSSRAVRKRDHGQRLFALLSLAIWARTLK